MPFDTVYLEFPSGDIFRISEQEINDRAIEYLESEIEGIRG